MILYIHSNDEDEETEGNIVKINAQMNNDTNEFIIDLDKDRFNIWIEEKQTTCIFYLSERPA